MDCGLRRWLRADGTVEGDGGITAAWPSLPVLRSRSMCLATYLCVPLIQVRIDPVPIRPVKRGEWFTGWGWRAGWFRMVGDPKGAIVSGVRRVTEMEQQAGFP